LFTNIHFVILPIADTNIFGRYSRYTDSRYNIGTTLVYYHTLVSIPLQNIAHLYLK